MSIIKIIRILFVVSLLLNIFLIYLWRENTEIKSEMLDQVIFRDLQQNLVQLQGTIRYQIDYQWSKEDHVVKKIEDIIEGIGTAFSVGTYSNGFRNVKEQTLWELYNFISNYDTGTGYPNLQLSEDEREEFIKLEQKLRNAGWQMNVGYSSDWNSFKEKTNILVKKNK